MQLLPFLTLLLTMHPFVLNASGTHTSETSLHHDTSHETTTLATPTFDASAFDPTLVSRTGWLDGMKRKLKRKMKLCISCNVAPPSPPRSPPRRTLSRGISFDNFRLHERFRAQGIGGDERHLPGRVDVSPIGVPGCRHGPTCAHVYGLEPHPPAAGGGPPAGHPP